MTFTKQQSLKRRKQSENKDYYSSYENVLQGDVFIGKIHARPINDICSISSSVREASERSLWVWTRLRFQYILNALTGLARGIID